MRHPERGGRRWLLALGAAVTLATVLAGALVGWLAAVTTYLLGTAVLVGLLLMRRT